MREPVEAAIKKVEIDMRAQYNFIFFRTGVFEAEKIGYGEEFDGPSLVVKNNLDMFEEVKDLVAWLSRK